MQKSIAELVRMVRQGDVTARDLVEQALERTEAKAELNAFIMLDGAGALSKARRVDAMVASGNNLGPLAGVPVVVKDNINIERIRTTAGTPAIHFIPAVSAPVVARLEAAHAIVIGKTNMHELAFGVTSNNAAFGAVHNAVDPTRFPGGSSGGTAAAIAAGIVPAGLGTDTAGSVRLPAALNGVAGFRPTTRRVDQEGVVPSVPTFDTVGPLARSMADLALLNTVIGGEQVPKPRDLRGLRFGVARPHSDNLSPGVAAAIDEAHRRLETAGVTLVDVDLSPIFNACFEVGYPIGFHEMKRAMSAFLAKYQPRTSLQDVIDEIASPDVKAVYVNSVIGDGAPSVEAYKEAVGRLDEIRQSYTRILRGDSLDAVVYPAAPLEAQPIDGTTETVSLNGENVPTMQVYIRNLAPTSVYGAPGLSVPAGITSERLPVGLALDGLPDNDLDLLSIGLGVEAVLRR